MSRTELEKTYNPSLVESKIYQAWEKSGYFNPDKLPGRRTKPFSISMPPPNVTGELHLGHATGITLEDMMIRWRRMQGYKTLWLPGTDHAAISTQFMVEKLLASQGIDRKTIGREQFLKHVWHWKKKYGTRITQQIRQIGASCDWSREHFTMDKDLTLAVQTAFIKMYKDKLIYRGKRIINWCARCGSAISDLEVKYKTEKGKLWYIRYPLFGTTKFLTVATTRPETMLGDTAVAVNPKDKKYQKLIGKTLLLPIMEREIPIIADHRVDMNFGTGAVKVTPAHDATDYEIGLHHHLALISVIGFDNKMTKEAGEFFGMSVLAARQNIVQKLQEEHLLEKIGDYTHNVGYCERCGCIIEPLISEQWFVKIKPLAEQAIGAVKSGKIKIIPPRFTKVYFHWMNNIRDWCISRQLWWGHQIPVWYCQKCKEPVVSIQKPKACAQCKSKGFKQDPDTLDTWFSSGLWTFSTLGWPKKTKDLKTFHPTSVMETAWDILFFWVARMIMMSLYFMKGVPFKTIYLHGLILDKYGKKMSKSKGTGVDPIPMAQKYGTDAIRLSLVLGTAAGQDFRLYEEKIAGYRNFVNKIWNVSRFILAQPKPKGELVIKTLSDQWILSRLHKLVEQVTKNLESFRFSEAGTAIYEFTWHEFADWYLEIAKTEKNTCILYYVLENILKLAHPFIPFVTEEIWSRLKSKKHLLMIEAWPASEKKLINQSAEKEFELLKNFIINIRNFRAEHKIPVERKMVVSYWGKSSQLVDGHSEIVKRLANLAKLENKRESKISGTLTGVDYFAQFERDEKLIKKEREKISHLILYYEQKLSNKHFLEKAPKEIIEQTKQKLEEQRERLQKLI